MSNSAEQGVVERGSRLFRNLHVVGAVALGGAALALPEFGAPLVALAALELAHAGLWEVARTYGARRRHATA